MQGQPFVGCAGAKASWSSTVVPNAEERVFLLGIIGIKSFPIFNQFSLEHQLPEITWHVRVFSLC